MPLIDRLRGPVPWLCALPLLCGALVLLWGKGSQLHPGMQPGRSAGALLLVGAVLALVLPNRLRWSWSSPLPWLTAALLWQGLALATWAVVSEPGLVWWSERAGGLLTAIAAAAWFRTVPAQHLLPALAAGAAGLLALGVASGGPWSRQWMTGPDLPFGNPNFVVGGALPLLGLALPYLRLSGARVALLLGLVSAVVLGTGVLSGDPCRAVWPGLGALLGTWLILLLPARSHGWIMGLGEVVVLTLLALLISDVIALPDNSPSSHYRLAIWRAAVEAIGQHPWFGTGPASAIVVLQEQVWSPVAWLWVPSYAEHAHNEYLNALVEGGVIGAALLFAGLLLTLAPLWRRRAEPAAMALLIAWAGVLTQAQIESHLGQPGPVLLLALLAGATWAIAQPEAAQAPASLPATLAAAEPPRPGQLSQTVVAVLVAALCFAMLAREFTDGGSPTMIEFRAQRKMAADRADAAAVAEEVRARLGSLDTWLTIEAEARHEHGDDQGAATLIIEQLARLPVDVSAVVLGVTLRNARRAKQQPVPELQAALEMARQRGERLLQQVPATPRTAQLREVLKRMYARI